MDITKIIIPAAGLGTRFLPITKSIAKEMLPLLNKPAIHYIIQEGKASGINNFILIISAYKDAIRHYFTFDQHLSDQLKENGKQALLQPLDELIASTQFSYIDQPQPLGLGHAILMAKNSIADEFFGVMLPDDIIINEHPALLQLIDIAQEQRAIVIAVQEVAPELLSSYGVIGIKAQINENLFEVHQLIEKPDRQDAPSHLAVIGRYILSPHIFDALENIAPSKNGELQLTDALNLLLHRGHKILAYKIQGSRFDIGTPTGWLHANKEISQLI